MPAERPASYLLMRIKVIVILFLTFALNSGCKESVEENILIRLMNEHPDQFGDILSNRDNYELQVIYTRIDRNGNNEPSFSTYRFNTDSERYFYPASTVKMPVALLALEKLNDLGIDVVNRNTTMLTDSVYAGQTSVYEDSTAANGLPSVAHYVKKIFVVSDNDAYNRLYEFVGPEAIRNKMRAKGFDDARIVHRLSIALTEDENRHTNPVRFVVNGEEKFSQPEAYYDGELDLQTGITKGVGYISNGELVEEPMEFGSKNFIPLDELNGILQRIIFPESFPESKRFAISDEDLKFVRKCISQLPGETAYPPYPVDEYYDAYSKFLLYGSDSTQSIPSHIRIFNKIGLAYGYATDVAYVVDFENNVEFMLAATIHTNRNRIYNDGEYEYEETAFPFMRDLGQLIYNYELKRPRQYEPDLSAFRLLYDKPKEHI